MAAARRHAEILGLHGRIRCWLSLERAIVVLHLERRRQGVVASLPMRLLRRARAAAQRLAANPRLFIARQYRSRIRPRLVRSPSGTVIGVLEGGVRFEFDFAYAPVLLTMWHHAYEMEVLEVLARFLGRGDVFVDVGANIGFFSAVALGLVGERGEVHCFEPAPAHYRRLERLRELNPTHQLHLNDCALGQSEGESILNISSGPNIGWNTLVPGFMAADPDREEVAVPIRRLDAYLAESAIDRIALIKIDVEGYELPVLKGLSYAFARGLKPPIVCEITPSAYPRLGTDVRELWTYMRANGYRVASILDPRRDEVLSTVADTSNVLFLPR